MSKNTIIPKSWHESFNELKEDVTSSVDKWLSRLKPEECLDVEQELGSLRPFNSALKPRVNVKEDDDTVTVIAEIPGLRKEDLYIDIDGRQLTISGQKEESVEKNKGHVYVSELRYGAFTRILTLPCEIDRDTVKAKYRRGVLKLTLPKTEEAKARRIEVQYEE